MEKALEGLKEGPFAKTRLDSIRAILKKYQIGKRQAMIASIDTSLKKLTSIYDRLAIEMNRYREETEIPEWVTKGKTTLIQKDPKKESPPTTTDP